MVMESVELTEAPLGLQPYVLIEAKLGPDGDDDLRLVINSGGGVDTPADAASMLAMALAEMPGGINLMRQVIAEADSIA